MRHCKLYNLKATPIKIYFILAVDHMTVYVMGVSLCDIYSAGHKQFEFGNIICLRLVSAAPMWPNVGLAHLI